LAYKHCLVSFPFLNSFLTSSLLTSFFAERPPLLNLTSSHPFPIHIGRTSPLIPTPALIVHQATHLPAFSPKTPTSPGGDAVRIQAALNPGRGCGGMCCTGFDLVVQKIEPGPTPGFCFLGASGTILEKDLEPGEVIVVSTGCVVGFSTKVTQGIRSNGGCCTCCFSGEGLFSTSLEGPGKVMLQSMPLDKIRSLFPTAGRMGGTDISSAGDA